MSSGNRYTEEFKIEAVRQVTERGHALAEVARAAGRVAVVAATLEAALRNGAGRAHRGV